MAQLVVLGFLTESAADDFLDVLKQMGRDHVLGLSDVVKVVRAEDGEVTLDQKMSPMGREAANGAFWGTLVGVIFAAPVVGAAAGAAIGAAHSKKVDIGINDEFIRETAEQLPPGYTGVFLMVEQAVPEKVAEVIEGVHARVITTTLEPDKEMQLRELLSPDSTL